MKYCTKCGAQMVDEARFCPKCGNKVAEITEQAYEPSQQEPVVQESPKTANKNVKSPAKPLHEQTLKDFLPLSLVIVICTFALWIVQSLAHPTGILRVMPLIIFMIPSATYGAMNLIRAVKCYKLQSYYKAALSLVLSGLLITCLIIDFIRLIGG